MSRQPRGARAKSTGRLSTSRLAPNSDDGRPGARMGDKQFDFANGMLRDLERDDRDTPQPGDTAEDLYYKRRTKKLPRPSDMVSARHQQHEDLWAEAEGMLTRKPKITSPTGDTSTDIVITEEPPTDMWFNMPVKAQRA